jgi:uncharacterized SAM-binding protein YcdF (DUF218 family)
MLRRLFHAVLLGILLISLASMASFLYLCWQINRTGSHDQAQAADAIVVLGARVEKDGLAGPDLRSRTLHAVRLFRRDLAPYMVCTGGYENDRLSAAAVARRLAVSRGVPAQRILLADGSMTTREDAISTRQLSREHGFRTLILVSHPLHLERARLLFEAQGLTVFPSPTTTDLEAIPWRTRAWLTVREASGIVWAALESIGLPYEWTLPLSRWIYGSAHAALSVAS